MVESLKDKERLNLWVPEPAHTSLSSFILPFCSLVLFLFSSYKVLYFILEKYESEITNHTGRFIYVMVPYTTVLIFLNLLFVILYKYDKEFTHKFKINSEPWPWEEDPEKWKVMLPKGIKRYVKILNIFFQETNF